MPGMQPASQSMFVPTVVAGCHQGHTEQQSECHLLVQGFAVCLLEAVPLSPVPADSPALLKALAAIVGSPGARSASFMTREGFAVPIYLVRLTLFRVHHCNACSMCLAAIAPNSQTS